MKVEGGAALLPENDPQAGMPVRLDDVAYRQLVAAGVCTLCMGYTYWLATTPSDSGGLAIIGTVPCPACRSCAGPNRGRVDGSEP